MDKEELILYESKPSNLAIVLTGICGFLGWQLFVDLLNWLTSTSTSEQNVALTLIVFVSFSLTLIEVILIFSTKVKVTMNTIYYKSLFSEFEFSLAEDVESISFKGIRKTLVVKGKKIKIFVDNGTKFATALYARFNELNKNIIKDILWKYCYVGIDKSHYLNKKEWQPIADGKVVCLKGNDARQEFNKQDKINTDRFVFCPLSEYSLNRVAPRNASAEKIDKMKLHDYFVYGTNLEKQYFWFYIVPGNNTGVGPFFIQKPKPITKTTNEYST